MIFKRKYKITIYHDNQFEDCPNQNHCHRGVIKVTAKLDLRDFFINDLIPSSHGSLNLFITGIYEEIKKYRPISIGVYLKDVDEEFIKFFEE